MTKMRTVLLDVGGVLTDDPWQSILLTPLVGLADSLGLDRAAVEQAGDDLWPRYSLATRTESDYWSEFSERVQREITPDAVQAAELACLTANPFAARVFETLSRSGIRWGFISDNTAFWFVKQIRLLGQAEFPTADLRYLSYELGVSKTSDRIGLFEQAAELIDPNTTVVVDDRAGNIARAAACGFNVLPYNMASGSDLMDALSVTLSQ